MINDLLNIEEVERNLFKRHFIRNVVLEITVNSLQKSLLIRNKEAIKKDFLELGFNHFMDIKQVEFKMTSEEDLPEQIQNDEIIGLLFLNDEKKFRVELIENRIIISVFKYLNFDTFILQVKKMISILVNIVSTLKTINCISLKKQNTIISTETRSFDDIASILNKTLMPSIHDKAIPFENFDHSNNEFGVIKNGYRCRIDSGCLRKSDDEFEINLSILVISNVESSINDIVEDLQKINNFNFSIFCWATTNEFKNVMNEEVK